jgi:hypothetical protein
MPEQALLWTHEGSTWKSDSQVRLQKIVTPKQNQSNCSNFGLSIIIMLPILEFNVDLCLAKVNKMCLREEALPLRREIKKDST